MDFEDFLREANTTPDYNTNAGSYYKELARKQELIKLLAKKIWDYEELLDESLENLSLRLESYINENDSLMSERLKNWDERIENLDEEVSHIFVEWLEDGTLEQIINHDVLGNKADKADLDKVTAQLAQNVTAYVADETVGNSIVAGEEYSVSYLREKQINLLSRFYQMFRERTPQIVAAQGDSMTYGHDTTSSDKRPIDPAVLPDGSRHIQTRASVTYPEALQEYLTKINNTTTVINRGYSGDKVDTAYNRWITPSGAHLTFLMYGINDANTGVTGDIKAFQEDYKKLVAREILRNTAVVILIPTKSSNTNTNADQLTACLYEIGNMFSVPVVDAALMTSNYSGSEIYSDYTHFNGKGYRLLGAKIASLFVGEGLLNPLSVYAGTKLLARPALDNCWVFAGAGYEGSVGIDTPDELYDTDGAGVAVKLQGQNQRVYYSFYTEQDDMVVVPSLYFSGTSNITIESDFNVAKPKNNFGNLDGGKNTINSTGVVTSYSMTSTGSSFFDRESLTHSRDERYLSFPRKGWHTISITMTTQPTGYVYVKGLEFISKKDFKQHFNKGYFNFLCESGTETTTTEIDVFELCESLGVTPLEDSFWKSLPCTITVHNFSQSVRQYAFNLSDIRNNSNWFLSKNNTVYNLTDAPIDERTLQALSFNPTTKKITLTWGGNVSRGTSVTVKVA